jgi:hypothetical protein
MDLPPTLNIGVDFEYKHNNGEKSKIFRAKMFEIKYTFFLSEELFY